MPVGLFVILAVPVIATWMGFRDADRRAATAQVQIIADQASFRMEEYVEARLFLLEVIRRDVEKQGLDRERFVALAESVREELQGFRAINWVDAQGVIQWVSPVDGNEGAIGRNVFEHPAAGPALTLAREARRPAITPPLDLFQGGRAFTGYVPVLNGAGQPRGYVNGVFLLDPLVRDLLAGGVLDQYDLLITDGGELLFGEWPAPGTSESGVQGVSTVKILDRVWNLSVTPRPETALPLNRASSLVFVIGGLALALALAVLLHVVIRNQELRRRTLHERSVLEMRLRHSQKMEAIGLLAGGVAHDFNNVLTAVLGNAALARGATEEKREHYLDNIRDACGRAAQLTGQLLTFSRKQVVTTERLDLSKEVEAQRALIRPLVREDVHLAVSLDDDAGFVEVNPSHVSQVLMNLLVNALDALPHGGEIYVETHLEAVSPRGEAGPWAVLEVRDTGTGMSEEVRARVIEPFYTTKAPGKGTGLGLATVYGIATGANGFLTIDSEPGEGTRVRVWFPQTVPETRTEREVAAETPVAMQGTVLVVEDEDDVREVTARLLRLEDFTLLEARDGTEALELFDGTNEIDVVLTDSVMPRMGGLELLRELRNRGSDAGVIISSGYADNIRPDDLKRLNAVFFAKPFSYTELIEIVRGRLRVRSTAKA
ncbi:MAG: response regulator [Gemmatimonadetes bacterium]|nr:response regulator [Gemmatimonadota bacterium]